MDSPGQISPDDGVAHAMTNTAVSIINLIQALSPAFVFYIMWWTILTIVACCIGQFFGVTITLSNVMKRLLYKEARSKASKELDAEWAANAAEMPRTLLLLVLHFLFQHFEKLTKAFCIVSLKIVNTVRCLLLSILFFTPAFLTGNSERVNPRVKKVMQRLKHGRVKETGSTDEIGIQLEGAQKNGYNSMAKDQLSEDSDLGLADGEVVSYYGNRPNFAANRSEEEIARLNEVCISTKSDPGLTNHSTSGNNMLRKRHDSTLESHLKVNIINNDKNLILKKMNMEKDFGKFSAPIVRKPVQKSKFNACSGKCSHRIDKTHSTQGILSALDSSSSTSQESHNDKYFKASEVLTPTPDISILPAAICNHPETDVNNNNRKMTSTIDEISTSKNVDIMNSFQGQGKNGECKKSVICNNGDCSSSKKTPLLTDAKNNNSNKSLVSAFITKLKNLFFKCHRDEDIMHRGSGDFEPNLFIKNSAKKAIVPVTTSQIQNNNNYDFSTKEKQVPETPTERQEKDVSAKRTKFFYIREPLNIGMSKTGGTASTASRELNDDLVYKPAQKPVCPWSNQGRSLRKDVFQTCQCGLPGPVHKPTSQTLFNASGENMLHCQSSGNPKKLNNDFNKKIQAKKQNCQEEKILRMKAKLFQGIIEFRSKCSVVIAKTSIKESSNKVDNFKNRSTNLFSKKLIVPRSDIGDTNRKNSPKLLRSEVEGRNVQKSTVRSLSDNYIRNSKIDTIKKLNKSDTSVKSQSDASLNSQSDATVNSESDASVNSQSDASLNSQSDASVSSQSDTSEEISSQIYNPKQKNIPADLFTSDKGNGKRFTKPQEANADLPIVSEVLLPISPKYCLKLAIKDMSQYIHQDLDRFKISDPADMLAISSELIPVSSADHHVDVKEMSFSEDSVTSSECDSLLSSTGEPGLGECCTESTSNSSVGEEDISYHLSDLLKTHSELNLKHLHSNRHVREEMLNYYKDFRPSSP